MKENLGDKEHYIKIIDSLDLDETQRQIVKTTWLDYLLLMNKSARKGWLSHNYSQILVIVVSLLIPIIEPTTLNYNIHESGLKVISILGLIVAALTTLNRQLGFEEKWRHYRKTAELMRNEGDDFFALSGEYEKFKAQGEAFQTFVKTITLYKRYEVTSYIEEEKRRNDKTEGTKEHL
jgi:hypothetical protein